MTKCCRDEVLLEESYARFIKWYNAANSKSVGRELGASACIWGLSDIHTDAQGGKGANMKWLHSLHPRLDDTIIIAGADRCFIKLDAAHQTNCCSFLLFR